MRKLISLLSLVLLVCISTANAQSDFAITHLPHLQGLTGNSVQIVWTTSKPAIAWVELAPDDSTHFYLKERPKFFNNQYGFKSVGTVHSVHLKELSPNTTYRYRIYSQEVTDHVRNNVTYGRVVATNVYTQAPLKFTTLGKKEQFNFTVINDIHGRNDVMNKLLDVANVNKTDFVIFNGDMADNLLSEKQMYDAFMDTAIKRFASEKPLYYSRGNHETRGPFAIEYPKYFPTPTGELYYALNYGEASIIILDCGEDKPDSDIEYSGIVDMDFYRTEQAKWLEKAVQKPEFVNAKYKIIICHMPPFGGWHGEEEIMRKFVPILNKAGAQIMISGHLHRHVVQKPNTAIHFPVLINSNNNVVKVDVNAKTATVKVLDQTGKIVEKIELPALR